MSHCLGKIRYTSRSEANRARRSLYEKPGYCKGGNGRESSMVMSVYSCHCGGFHIGRDKTRGMAPKRRTPDHERSSAKNRLARWKELTEQ